MKLWTLVGLALFSLNAAAKTFQNSYVAFEVPDNWNCLQEGVAWTCTPAGPLEAKEAVIVLASKVAGPEDNLQNFLTYLKQPKKLLTKVGTPMPSQMMYAQQRQLAGNNWVQSQHFGSEILEYYTLYLATVKEQLAILVSFSAERNHYKTYNPIFDKAIKTLRIVASQQLLIPKNYGGRGSEVIGIQMQPGMAGDSLLPPPEKKRTSANSLMALFSLIVILAGVVFWMLRSKKQKKPVSGTPERKIHRIKVD